MYSAGLKDWSPAQSSWPVGATHVGGGGGCAVTGDRFSHVSEGKAWCQSIWKRGDWNMGVQSVIMGWRGGHSGVVHSLNGGSQMGQR